MGIDSRISRVLKASAALGAALTIVACSGGEAKQQTPPAPGPGAGRGGGQAPAVPVNIDRVVEKDMPLDVQVIGTVIAASTVAVRGQVTGEMTSVDFKEGEEVEAGQVLFTLDKRPYEAALLQAQANLERDAAQAKNAQAQAARYDDLLKRGIATREQVDSMTTQAAALAGTVAADRAAIESAKVQLDFTTITAPIAGRTGLLQVHKGNLVRSGDQVLVTINRVMPVYVSFAVPESMLPDFKKYLANRSLRVEAKAPTEPGAESVGKIDFIDNAVDVTTGTIKVKGTFPNEDRKLWPGQFVNVNVTLTNDPRMTVLPSAAVQTGQQGSYVYIVKADQTVDLRPVTIRRTRGEESIVQSGVAPGDVVVTDGHLRLVPGSRISAKNAAKAAP
jgi:multidrug efflux system membrane fusion protein